MSEQSDALFRRTMAKVAVIGFVLLTLTCILDVLRVTKQFYGTIAWMFFAFELFQTRMGQVIVARLVFGLLFFVTSRRLLTHPSISRRIWSFAHGLGVVITVSMLSHQAGKSGLLPLFTDVIHLTATALWGGGLLYFSLLPISAMEEEQNGIRRLGRVARRFSNLGLISVGVLTLTGVYVSSLHLSGFTALVETGYGVLLLRKLVVFALIIGVAGVHQLYFIPALTKDDARARLMHRRFLSLVRFEAVLLLALLVVVGFLTTEMPPHSP